MNTIPSLIIVTDRGHLMAYQLDDCGQIHRIDSATFPDGNDCILEISKNPTSSFPNSDGISACTIEDTTCVAELETGCFLRIAAKIREIIDRENAVCWAFVTSTEFNEAILAGLGDSYLQRLAINLKRNLAKVPQQEIKVHLERALLAAS